MQASGCRSQNWRMSPTVAVAADTASVALICAFDAGSDWLFGNKTTMTPSQNAIRNRKRIRLPLLPGGRFGRLQAQPSGQR
jgi:hypothetical protein